MAFSFGDGFDLYAAPADAINGYWDSGPNVTNLTLTAGRFSGSQAIVGGSGANPVLLVKSSGSNDAVHHLIVAFRQTSTITGSSLLFGLQLLDGTTAQCTVSFRTDGAIVLASGAAAGTVLATYTGAFPTANIWYAFEMEVIINNTTGRFRVRKNGNTVDDFDSGASLDTQNSANAYANKLQIGYVNVATGQNLDDLFWRSDASSVAFMGDIRCYTRMPTTDASVQFTQGPNPVTQTINVATSSSSLGTTGSYYISFVPLFTGTIGSVALSVNAPVTADIKASIFSSTGTAPAAILGSATLFSNPVAGFNTIVFPSPVSVTKGTSYYLGFANSAAVIYNTSAGNGSVSTLTNYAAFPVSNPTIGSVSNPPGAQIFVTMSSPPNAAFVSEPQEDGSFSYLTDNTVGHSDLYNIAAIGSTPNSTVAVTTRAFVQKTDAGSRTASVQLKSGSTVVQSSNPSLSTNTWTWLYRTDTVDPNTTLAWSAANVALAQIGPIIVT